MKALTSLLFSALFISCMAQQPSEFGNAAGSYIYDDETMNQLHFIVDSFNIKFRACELDLTMKSLPQTTGTYVFVDGRDAQKAVQMMQAGVDLERFIESFPKATVKRDRLILKLQYTNYRDEHIVEYSAQNLESGYDDDLQYVDDPEQYDRPVKNSWKYVYFEGSEYSSESVSAIYFPEEFKAAPIPETYARQIQYADCMVDTSTQIYLEDAVYTSWEGDSNLMHVRGFWKYIDAHGSARPEYDAFGEDYDAYYAAMEDWQEERHKIIDKLSSEPEFKTLLDLAKDEAMNHGNGYEEFEEIVRYYCSPEEALTLKRSRRVMGSCSMDDSPRVHAAQIAALSAEALNWEIFLRSHLDIMNDRFERASDGSYAQAGRKTYIGELEALDIDVQTLLLGITYRVEQPHPNHYYGNIFRLGRALTESNNRSAIETTMDRIIRDESLDVYNRLLVYYLYVNYNHYLEDGANKRRNVKQALAAAKSLPQHIQDQLSL